MDRQTFEADCKRDGYEIMTNTTQGAKVNPVHSHPFDVRAMVMQGSLTLSRDGKAETYRPGQVFSMPRGCLHFESYDDDGATVLLGRKF